MLTTLYLSGEIGHRFGRKHKLAVASPAEALRALEANHPGFAAYLIAAGDRGVDFRLKVDGEAVGEDRVRFECPGKTIRLSPVIAGRKSGVGQIIAGVALVAIAFVSQQYELLPYAWSAVGTTGWAAAGQFVGALGLSMAFGGISQMLSPMPRGPQLSEGKPSYIFNGPVNTVEQGGPVPLCYGFCLVGSRMVSTAMDADDIGAPIAAPSSSDDGEGPMTTDPNYPTTPGTATATNLRGRSLQARQLLRQIHLLSEGEVEGICDAAGNLLGSDERNKGILLDETPIQNADGSFPQKDKEVTTAFRAGLANQSWLAGFPSAESEVSVDTKVIKGSDKWANAVQREIPAGSHNAIRVTVRFPALYEIDNKGNRTGSAVHLGIQVKRVAETDWHYPVGGHLLPNGEIDGLIQGEATQPYLRSFRVPLEGTGPWLVSVARESADSPDATKIQNDLYWHSYTKITDDKFTYRHSAILGVSYSAERSANAAAVAVRLKGIKVRVPSNYDPVTRNYTGTWDGQFAGAPITLSVGHGAGDATLGIAPLAADLPLNSPIELYAGTTVHRAYLTVAATAGTTSLSITPINAAIPSGTTGYGYHLKWTNNPAWIYYDLSTHPRYGLGQYISGAALDKWALYDISRYCDGVDGSGNFVGVPTGRDDASREPRFTCNTYLQSTADAYQVLSDLSSCFRGMIYWGNGFITAVQDTPKIPRFSFTDANVIDGVFNFSSTAAKARHTVCYVQWNDPDDAFAAKFEEVQDDQGIEDLGVRPITIVAFGCTSRGQAKRAGQWKLLTERLENDTVTFRTGIEGARARPGDICRVSARFKTTNRMYGRLTAVDAGAGTLTLDAPAVIGSGAWTIFVARQDGTQVELGVTSGAGTHPTLSVTGSLTGIVPNAVFILRSAALEPALYRVLNVKELESRRHEITALLYNESKFAAIEEGLKVVIPPTSDLPPTDAPAAPATLEFRESFVDTASGTQRFLTATWSASPSWFTKDYVVEYRGPNGEWKLLDETTNLRAAPVLVTALGDHSFRVFARSTLGRRSDPKQGTYTLTEMSDPNPPTSLQIVPQGQGFFLTWTNPASANLTVIEIQESLNGTFNDPPAAPSPIVGTAAADKGLQGAFHRGGVTADFHRWYRIRARNASGGKSAWTSSVNATATVPPPGDSVQVQYSVDGVTGWHDVFTTGDRYMRQRIGSGDWSSAIRIVGDDGVRGSRSFIRELTGAAEWSDTEAEAAITSFGMTKTALDTVTLYKLPAGSFLGFSATKFWNPVATPLPAWDTVEQVIDGNLIVHGTIGADQIVSGVSLTSPRIEGGKLILKDSCTICAYPGADVDGNADTGLVRMNGGGGPNTVIPGNRGGQIDCFGNEYPDSEVTGAIAGSILLTPGAAESASLRLRDRTGADRIVIQPDGTVTIPGLVTTVSDVGVFLAKNFGASPGATASANATAIQAALDAAATAGGGTVVLPQGVLNCNPINTTGANTKLISYGGTTLKAPAANNAAMLLVRHSGFECRGITFDGSRDGHSATEDGSAWVGLLDVESNGSLIRDIRITDCEFKHGRVHGVQVQGTVENVEVSWNRFSDSFCQFLSDTNADGVPNRLLICNNDFGAGYSYAGLSGAIKILTNLELNPATGGKHVIKGNRIYQSGEMGIELWRQAGEDSVIDGNIVGGTHFGISMDNASRSVVSNNRVYGFSSYGIEIATGSRHMNVIGNNITDPLVNTAQAIAIQSDVAAPGDIQVLGNYLANITNAVAIHIRTGSNYSVIGNRFDNCAATINVQGSTGNVVIKDNFFIKITNGGIFMDVTDSNLTNLEITGNTFADSVDNAYSTIVIYDGGHSRTVRNVAITDNRFMDVKYVYHPINLDIPPLQLINYVVERNFGSLDNSTYAYLNPVQSSSVGQPFAQSAFGFGHAFEFRVDVVIPASANNRWYKLLDGANGNIVNFLFGIDYFDAEGGRRDVFQISAVPYAGGAVNYTKMSGVNTGGSSFIQEIIHDGPSSGSHELWIKVRPTTNPTHVSFYFSRLLATEKEVYIVRDPLTTEVVTTEPTWASPVKALPDGFEAPPGAIAFGYAYRKKWQITLPSSDSDKWVKIWSADYGNVISLTLAVQNEQFESVRSRNNIYHIVGSPYNFDASITQMPSAWRNTEVVSELVYNNPGGGSVQELWLRIAPNPGGPLTLWISELEDRIVDPVTFLDDAVDVEGFHHPYGLTFNASNHYRSKPVGFVSEMSTRHIRAQDSLISVPYGNTGEPHARLWIKDGAGQGAGYDKIVQIENTAGNSLLEIGTDGQTRMADYRGLKIAFEDGYVGFNVSKGKVTLPANAADRLIKVYSLDAGRPLNFLLHIEEDIDGRRSSQWYRITNGPYLQTMAVVRLPGAVFNEGITKEVIVNTTSATPDGFLSITEVWIRVRPTANAGVIHFWCNDHQGGLIEAPAPVPATAPTESIFTAGYYVKEVVEGWYSAYAANGFIGRRGIISANVGSAGGAVRARLCIKGNQPDGGDTARIALFQKDDIAGTEILDIRYDGLRVKGGGIDILDGNYYMQGQQVVTVRQTGPGTGAADAATDGAANAATDGATNAESSNPGATDGMIHPDLTGSDSVNRALLSTEINTHADKLNSFATKINGIGTVVTDNAAKYNALAGKYNDLAGKYNAVAGKYNGLAGKYNDLATRFNSLVAALQAHGLIG